jgi:caffeoyl-CoA O-methyltransferase
VVRTGAENMDNIINPRIEQYMRGLQARHDEPVLLEMEREGTERNFPIIGRSVGVTVEVLTRAIRARRVFELGSGFGYSAYWFSRAVGPDGELHLTDSDPANERRAMRYLARAGLDRPVRFHVGEALASLGETDGEFDVVYCDIDKQSYPHAWRAARERIRPRGLYICDNVLWSGHVAHSSSEEDPHSELTEAIREHNRLIAQDERYLSTIVPTRDGVLVALRVA